MPILQQKCNVHNIKSLIFTTKLLYRSISYKFNKYVGGMSRLAVGWDAREFGLAVSWDVVMSEKMKRQWNLAVTKTRHEVMASPFWSISHWNASFSIAILTMITSFSEFKDEKFLIEKMISFPMMQEYLKNNYFLVSIKSPY